MIDFRVVWVAHFGYPGSSSVCSRVHGVGILSLLKGGPGVIQFLQGSVPCYLLLPIIAVLPFDLSFSCHGLPVVIIARSVEAKGVSIEFVGQPISEEL